MSKEKKPQDIVVMTQKQKSNLSDYDERVKSCKKGMEAFAAMLRETETEMWKYIRSEFPKTEGYACSVSGTHKKPTIKVLYKDPNH